MEEFREELHTDTLGEADSGNDVANSCPCEQESAHVRDADSAQDARPFVPLGRSTFFADLGTLIQFPRGNACSIRPGDCPAIKKESLKVL